MSAPSSPDGPGGPGAAPRVLVVDDDRDIGALVEAVLTDAGYAVSLLYQLDGEVVAAAAGRLEPDCLLLDSSGAADYGASWALAERLAARDRPVPVVMFTAHGAAAAEALAREAVSSRVERFGEGNEEVSDARFSLGEVLEARGDVAGAREEYEVVLAQRLRKALLQRR